MNRLEKEIRKSISEWSDTSNSPRFMREAFSRTKALMKARSDKKIRSMEKRMGIDS